MAAETRSIEKKEILRNRRLRVFGLNNSILSDTTVYFNPLKKPMVIFPLKRLPCTTPWQSTSTKVTH